MTSLAVWAPAKLNLELKVLGKNDDGYHAIESVFQQIDIHDLLIAEIGKPFGLNVIGFDCGDLSSNTVIRAHRQIEQNFNKKIAVFYHLVKRIPPGSGLGGGSSDAAAVIRVLEHVVGAEVPFELALRIGSDVPFFVYGGRVKVSGVGEVLCPEHDVVNEWYVVAWPGVNASTAAVYKTYDSVGGEGANALERAALTLYPELVAFKRKLAGVCEGWLMTGSGSAFFCKFDRQYDAYRVFNVVRTFSKWCSVAMPLYQL
jgi:4-diphosphocytidyl-2-C-methyl-D-erythritol kinase